MQMFQCCNCRCFTLDKVADFLLCESHPVVSFICFMQLMGLSPRLVGLGELAQILVSLSKHVLHLLKNLDLLLTLIL